MQKIVVIKGSPRKEGNSATLAKRVAKGAESAGASVEDFYLHGMNIQPCRACDSCRDVSPGHCIIDDDMQILYPKVKEANSLVIASPVYWFTLSAQTKLFMDRLYAFGVSDEYIGLSGKRIGILMAYADPDPFSSGAVNALRTFQDAFNYVGAHIDGMVYGSALEAGEISRDQALMDKAYELGTRLGSTG
jgi:multimeric flavodoxin WrbA